MQLLKCSLINFTIISVFIDDISQFDPKKILVRNGEVTILVDKLSIKDNEIILYLKSEVNIKLPGSVSIYNASLPINYYPLYSTDEFNLRYYTDEELGIQYTREHTLFKLWSPAASYVNLLLYESGDPDSPEKPRKFKLQEKSGLWEVRVRGNLKGYFYTFELKVYDDVHEIVDPYARACGINGLRGAVIDLKETDPPGYIHHAPPHFDSSTDAIIYEINIRDLSIHPDSGIKSKGKYLALTEENTATSKGISTGLAHILELGATHVQLMPVFDYSFKSVDEKHPYRYNWGYDPQNYNIPEGSYAADAYNPCSRVYELKKAINALHKHGLSVIMDVVYNHIFKYEDSNLEKLFPGYYFRQNDDGTYCNGTGCGNDIASERPMVRKFILDSLLYWAREYKIDGFRFDLMGILDVKTMNEIGEKLGAGGLGLILYGEGWYMNTNLKDEDKAGMYNSHKLEHIGFYNDSIRDAVKGSVFNSLERGFVSGTPGLEDTVKFNLMGCSIDAFGKSAIFTSPGQCINYSSCHDNYTLWDKLRLSCPEASEEELKHMNKLADGIILTSMGVPFIHSGADFCRTKNGIENSYNSTDAVNRMDWHRKHHYLDVFEYYKGLIALRKSHSAFRLYDSRQIREHMEFIYTGRNSTAYILKNHANGDPWKDIIVIYNGSRDTVYVPLSQGNWNVVVDKFNAGTEPLYCINDNNVSVEPISMKILYLE
ncbi:MAG: type I pullulanase [Bacillota bacterium]|nr:type I pullulanase [Bacillota bacterium]